MFSETEDYLNVTKIIFEKKKEQQQQEEKEEENKDESTSAKSKSGNKFILDTGEYIYPFSVDLPKNIPETFEHSYGVINYSISAYLDIPMYTILFSFIHSFSFI